MACDRRLRHCVCGSGGWVQIEVGHERQLAQGEHRGGGRGVVSHRSDCVGGIGTPCLPCQALLAGSGRVPGSYRCAGATCLSCPGKVYTGAMSCPTFLYSNVMSEHGKRVGHETICGPIEVAALAGVQVGTVTRWRARGIAPEPDAVISRVPLWREQTIVAWLQQTGRLPGN